MPITVLAAQIGWERSRVSHALGFVSGMTRKTPSESSLASVSGT
jgi:hypothetical protein